MALKKMKMDDKGRSGDSDLMQKTQELAYAYYLERLRNNLPGNAVTDWAAAEKQIRGKKSA